jgi:hypothetical protein
MRLQTIPRGWRRVTSGNKRATDRFRSILTGAWVTYGKSDSFCREEIGRSIVPDNFVIRRIEKQTKRRAKR